MTRVAFIGAGQRTVGHLVALSHIPDVEVVALADLDTARAKLTQEQANARRKADTPPIQSKVFADYRQMLDAAAPDCLYLVLPPFVHGQLDHDVIDYGRPVLFEKPVALNVTLAHEIADHIRQKGIVNAAGFQMRYSSAVQKPAAMLAGQPIGMAISIRLSGLPGTPWWRVQAKSGGMLVEQHTHAVDLMRYLCGEIESVYAVAANRFSQDVPNLDIFDMNAVTVRFASGAPGIIGNSCAASAGAAVFPPHLVHVVARDMVLSVNTNKTVVHRAGAAPEEFLPEQSDNYVMAKAFIDATRSGRQDGILSSFDDAVKTLGVTLACQRSAEIGAPVELAEFMAG